MLDNFRKRIHEIDASALPDYSPVFLSECKAMAAALVFPGLIRDTPVDYETDLQKLVKKHGVDANQTSAIVDSFVKYFEKQKRKIEKAARRDASPFFRLFRRRKDDEETPGPDIGGV